MDRFLLQINLFGWVLNILLYIFAEIEPKLKIDMRKSIETKIAKWQTDWKIRIENWQKMDKNNYNKEKNKNEIIV